ncbi:AI-2E family transporter [Clostridium intestinale]|uniref:Predicted PurR-regulated permease PerM n=1 Tax=Clostridium intestinale DSM 6191 TaxID=1121320 RepID=A0A1M5UXH3_9CLOT|nr:AI-2E family transporter [Clostridium intestinale]SHH67705.1 Predicted PurR-regulated permease PerM [Clostridium intestinale DSM 6191]
MNFNKRNIMDIAKYLFLALFVVLVVKYSENIFSTIGNISGAAVPLISGLAMAYVLNILMKKLEKIYFPKSKNEIINKSRRAVCIFLAILLIIFIVVIVALIVIPELVNAISVIIAAIPKFVEDIIKFIDTNSDKYEVVENTLVTLQIDINEISRSVMTFASSLLTGVLNSIILFASTMANSLINFIISLVFAIYALANKEKLSYQIKKVMKAFLKNKSIEKINYVFHVINESFSNFIVGQCVEAVIIGGLCTAGMFVFSFPYAVTVGVFISVTALIPIVGAYLGAALGAFIILTVSPLKAVLFLLYITILQQLENTLIYPKVVGSSIGLPGIWVFAAITLGAGLGGIVGMLLSVPVAATIYNLFVDKVNKRLIEQEMKKE